MRALLKKLEAAFGSSVKVSGFGRSECMVVEIVSGRVEEVCSWLRMEESFRLDFLEAFTAFEAKGKLNFSLFLRSMAIGHSLVVRMSAPLADEKEWVEFPSLGKIWTQATSFESELSPLFGVRFVGGRSSGVKRNFGSFDGFPMRKHYEWGTETTP